ncbi:unnamed protein product [Caenorhabditis brenneri]
MARPRRSEKKSSDAPAPAPQPAPTVVSNEEEDNDVVIVEDSDSDIEVLPTVNLDEKKEDDDIMIVAEKPPLPPDIEPDLSNAVLVCKSPRIIRNTIDVDILWEVEKKREKKRDRTSNLYYKYGNMEPETPTHLEYVRDALDTIDKSRSMMEPIRPDPVTPVIAVQKTSKPKKTVTYLYNLDHDEDPILGGDEKNEYAEKYLYKPKPLTKAEKCRRAKQQKEREKAEAQIKAEREAQKALPREPCGCRPGRPGH